MSRKLSYIKSYRNCINVPSFNTVYEWEDILSAKLNLKILKPGKLEKFVLSKLLRKVGLVNLYYKILKQHDEMALLFAMQADTVQDGFYDKNTIVVIIDFWLSINELNSFYQVYENCPLLLITNYEVFEFLKNNNCPIPIEHWPLSLPDSIEVKLSPKKFDFCFIGRKDPYFVNMVEKYASKNKDFTYITTNDDIEHRVYLNNKGEVVMQDEGRSSYLQMIRDTKITTYTTPGYDKAKTITKSFNQVTPRVLEMISGGCYVLGHYPDNYETQYYELKTMVPQIENYDDFEYYMDLYLKSPNRDIEECVEYLNKHNTSSRIPLLIDVLRKHNIIL